jgi:diphthine-ammonia ligase
MLNVAAIDDDAAMKYVALLSGGKDSCFNLLHCQHNHHQLLAAATLSPHSGKGASTSHKPSSLAQQ